MMLKRLFPYCLILLTASCYKYDKPKKPENLISKEKMVDIIMDVRLLSSASGANKTILEENNLQAETYVYNKYNIDSLQFALSNSYYAYYIDDYNTIYEKVKDSLEALKSKYDDLLVLEAEEKAFNDSIYKLIEKDSKRILQLKDSLNFFVEKDSLQPLNKRDSIRLVRLEDSLAVMIKKDSLTKTKLKIKSEKKLIKPVSDRDFQ